LFRFFPNHSSSIAALARRAAPLADKRQQLRGGLRNERRGADSLGVPSSASRKGDTAAEFSLIVQNCDEA
jgi:hypothetical protein